MVKFICAHSFEPEKVSTSCKMITFAKSIGLNFLIIKDMFKLQLPKLNFQCLLKFI